MDDHIENVEPGKAYRLINHGPTVLVSSHHAGVDNVMAAAWCCALDFAPPKLMVVIDKSTATRAMVEQSGRFVIQIPTAAQLQLTHDVGTISLEDDPAKLHSCGARLFRMAGSDLPFVAGCAAWLACQVVPEPHMQETYDLFIAEITGAWADSRIFKNGHWLYEQATPEWRSLHHVAGGHFYAIGEALQARSRNS